jgi:hypothetical protein
MPQRNLRFSRAVLAGALLAVLAAPAHAHNETPRQDRSDNVVAFDYET